MKHLLTLLFFICSIGCILGEGGDGSTGISGDTKVDFVLTKIE